MEFIIIYGIVCFLCFIVVGIIIEYSDYKKEKLKAIQRKKFYLTQNQLAQLTTWQRLYYRVHHE